MMPWGVQLQPACARLTRGKRHWGVAEGDCHGVCPPVELYSMGEDGRHGAARPRTWRRRTDGPAEPLECGRSGLKFGAAAREKRHRGAPRASGRASGVSQGPGHDWRHGLGEA